MLKIKHGAWAKEMLLFVALFPLIFQFLTYNMGFPSAVKYLMDVALIILFLKYIKSFVVWKGNKWLYLYCLAFLMFTLFDYFINHQSVLYYFWGLRNNFRFYLFFLLCLLILKQNNIRFIYKAFDVFLVLNVIVVSYQYWVQGINQDTLGGLFGTVTGCNGYMNIFLVIVFSKAVLEYINKEKTIVHCLAVLGMTVYIAALAEMKFYFAEVVIVVAVAILITDFSFRKIVLIIGSLVCVIIGVNILISIFPIWSDTFSIEGFIRIATDSRGYTSSGDLNRLTGVQTISMQYFNNIFENLFGYGLGNCDYSDSIRILNTPFYQANSWLHYTWMSTTFIFFELGAVGLLFYFGFFIVLYFLARAKAKRQHERKKECELAQIIAVLCCFIGIYNSSLRTEASYLIYLVLSFPFLKKAID